MWGGKDTALGRVQAQSSHLYTGLMHNVDWGPTLFSAGGGNASRIIDAHALDGVDAWPSILSSAEGQEVPSPRKDVLLHLQVAACVL